MYNYDASIKNVGKNKDYYFHILEKMTFEQLSKSPYKSTNTETFIISSYGNLKS